MKYRIAITLKLVGELLLHSVPARHIEDFTPVLYTEKRTVRVTAHPNRRSMTYGVLRGEKLQCSLRHSFHQLHHCWQRCMMRLNFSF
jgi:hypothetical protein